MARLLGIDVGTTGVRAGVFDEQGALLGEASEACAYAAPAPGRAEADAEAWWAAVGSACARLGAQASLEGVDAVGVTGQAPTAVLVDGAGRALRPALLWLDVRAGAEARALEGALGPGRAEALGGNRMHAFYLGPKLAWLRAHEPEAMERAALVLQSHAFVAMRLTGEAACDPSTAMLCAPLFDAAALGWSEEGARAAGVPLGKLPRIVRSHDVLGTVTREAAAATGLRAGTPVVAGGGDFAASALGAGVVEEGRACLMLGTAGNLLMPTEAPRFDARLINSHHVGCDRWLALGGTLCGAALEWFRRALAPDVPWETLEAEARAVEPAEGLVALPYLQGERTPVWDEAARGAFFGLELGQGRGHLYRAMLEGIALGFRDCLEVAEEHGVRFAEVVAANGAGRNALLRQTLADALGVPVTWSSRGGGTLAGAAILAGLGAGVLASAGAATTGSWRPRDPVRHEPDPRSHARLRGVLARRRALYEAVRAVDGS
ncbi:MAG TPA: FGGY family carbohydrate kinase [Polyangiaceae bacterium]|jgi:xylulokinase